MDTVLSVGMSIVSFVATTVKYLSVTVFAVGAVAAYTKPSEESLLPYARQWANKSALQQTAEGLLDPRSKPGYQDVIFFRVAEYDGLRFLGVFGAWFKTGMAPEIHSS